MDSYQNIELVNQAIQKLLEEKRNRDASGCSLVEDDDDQLLLSRLLSQLESLKEDGALKQPEVLIGQGAMSSPVAVVKEDAKVENAGQVDGGSNEISTQEIVEELKKVKKQNSITHWLLSALIVVTLAWQLSEVTLIIKVKEGLNHPFRSFGGLLAGMLKGPGKNGVDAERESSSSKEDQNHHNETLSFPSSECLSSPM